MKPSVRAAHCRFALVLLVLASGCGGVARSSQEHAALLQRRTESKDTYLENTRGRYEVVFKRLKREQEDYLAVRKTNLTLRRDGVSFEVTHAGVIQW